MILVYFVVLRMELRTTYMLGNHFAAEIPPQTVREKKLILLLGT